MDMAAEESTCWYFPTNAVVGCEVIYPSLMVVQSLLDDWPPPTVDTKAGGCCTFFLVREV